MNYKYVNIHKIKERNMNKEVEVMSFGKNLKEFREKAGLSQGELSRKVYTSQQMIGSIEQEIRMPSLPLALALAHELGTDVETLSGFNNVSE